MAEAAGLIASFKNVVVVVKTDKQGRIHLGITEHGRPFSKRQVGADQNAGALVGL